MMSKVTQMRRRRVAPISLETDTLSRTDQYRAILKKAIETSPFRKMALDRRGRQGNASFKLHHEDWLYFLGETTETDRE